MSVYYNSLLGDTNFKFFARLRVPRELTVGEVLYLGLSPELVAPTRVRSQTNCPNIGA